MLEIVFDIQYIKCDDTESGIMLSSDTVMHNCYLEGLPELLKEITLYFTFEKPDDITLKIEHDH